MMQLTDEQNFNLADIVYEDINLKINKKIRIKDGSQWITINSVNDPSGLQAIAVVPLKDYQAMQAGKVTTYPDVIFSSRGSQTDHAGEALKDWLETDTVELGLAQKPEHYQNMKDKNGKLLTPEKESQFRGYEKFVRDTLNSTQFDKTTCSFTGHSLGGSLAQYMAVLTDSKATTFAAARAYRLLPPELQKAVREGNYDDLIRDYRHKNDPVGYVPLGEIIGSRYMAKSASSDLVGMGHTRGSFQGMFNGDGSVMVRIHPEAILNQLPLFDSAIQNLYFTQEMIETVTDNLDREIQKIYTTYLDKMGTDSFSHLKSTDVEDIFEEFAQSREGSSYYFYDRQQKELLLDNLEKTKRQLTHQKNTIETAAILFKTQDQQLEKKISQLFGR
ncbi:hypothetical protein ACWOFR_01005 [Carnobacterium gallinarum]|uniref:hypothetical protein n=1 Tax=Carnobacterium gallinarum TaxID=2749 RepID=UPI00068D6443|nr:hypothetical protein [Carnobacterium gallinarum]